MQTEDRSLCVITDEVGKLIGVIYRERDGKYVTSKISPFSQVELRQLIEGKYGEKPIDHEN